MIPVANPREFNFSSLKGELAMASQTRHNIEDVLKTWQRLPLEKVHDDRTLYDARRKGSEIREAILVPVRYPRFEPVTLKLECPFCKCALDLRLHVDDLKKCARCDAFVCIAIDIVRKTYFAYGLKELREEDNQHVHPANYPFGGRECPKCY